jgi:hypothetical protein
MYKYSTSIAHTRKNEGQQRQQHALAERAPAPQHGQHRRHDASM